MVSVGLHVYHHVGWKWYHIDSDSIETLFTLSQVCMLDINSRGDPGRTVNEHSETNTHIYLLILIRGL